MNILGLTAALAGFTGVALGAFGAHGLKDRLSAEALGWWETATLYVLVHAGVALALALSQQQGLMRHAGWAFIVGACLFGGSLYAMALGAPRFLGAVTPLGGLAFLTGWALVAAAMIRR